MLWRVIFTLRCSVRHYAGTAFVLRADETVFRLIRSHPHAKADHSLKHNSVISVNPHTHFSFAIGLHDLYNGNQNLQI